MEEEIWAFKFKKPLFPKINYYRRYNLEVRFMDKTGEVLAEYQLGDVNTLATIQDYEKFQYRWLITTARGQRLDKSKWTFPETLNKTSCI
jgi:hypothetical protein